MTGWILLALDLPRFRGGLRAWDQGIWSDGILLSCLVPFFCSAPGGAILPSRPARWCGRRAQRRSRTAPLGGRPEGLSLTAASTAADSDARSGQGGHRSDYSVSCFLSERQEERGVKTSDSQVTTHPIFGCSSNPI